MKRLFAFALMAAAIAGSASGAHARQWKPTSTKKALEYLQIQYHTPDRGFMFVQWLAPAMFENTPPYEFVREITSKYVIVMLGHGQITKMGEWRFTIPQKVVIETPDRKIRRPLSEEEMPPAVFAFITSVSRTVARGLGPMGARSVTKVFSAEGISDCGKGGFGVHYAGELFEYKTPVPGCESAGQSDKQSLR